MLFGSAFSWWPWFGAAAGGWTARGVDRRAPGWKGPPSWAEHRRGAARRRSQASRAVDGSRLVPGHVFQNPERQHYRNWRTRGLRTKDRAPANPAMLDVLAAAYAESGQFDKADETEQRAIALTDDAKQRSVFQKRIGSATPKTNLGLNCKGQLAQPLMTLDVSSANSMPLDGASSHVAFRNVVFDLFCELWSVRIWRRARRDMGRGTDFISRLPGVRSRRVSGRRLGQAHRVAGSAYQICRLCHRQPPNEIHGRATTVEKPFAVEV